MLWELRQCCVLAPQVFWAHLPSAVCPTALTAPKVNAGSRFLAYSGFPGPITWMVKIQTLYTAGSFVGSQDSLITVNNITTMYQHFRRVLIKIFPPKSSIPQMVFRYSYNFIDLIFKICVYQNNSQVWNHLSGMNSLAIPTEAVQSTELPQVASLPRITLSLHSASIVLHSSTCRHLS